jgi:hypothetical protein
MGKILGYYPAIGKYPLNLPLALHEIDILT